MLVVVVPSSIRNWVERKAIRNSWGRWLIDVSFTKSGSQQRTLRDSSSVGKVHNNTWSTIGNNGKLETSNKSKVAYEFDELNSMLKSKLVFLLGRELRGNQPSQSILKEQKLYGDLLVEDFVDSYQNLTLKSCFMLKYIRDKCRGAKFVAKIDDDIFLHVPNLHNTLLDKTSPDELLMGSLFCNSSPVKNPMDKWYCPNHMFTGDTYPNYLSGTGYVVSGNLMSPLLEAALVTPLFHMEDIYVTGILAAKIGVHPTDDVGFSERTRGINPCLFQVSAF